MPINTSQINLSCLKSVLLQQGLKSQIFKRARLDSRQVQFQPSSNAPDYKTKW